MEMDQDGEKMKYGFYYKNSGLRNRLEKKHI